MKSRAFHSSVFGLLIALAALLPSSAMADPYVMKFGLAAPDLNPSFWATHYNYFKYEV
jgi:hypothetical protein